MPPLEWSEELCLGLEPMDQTHREFVDLLAAVDAATDATLLTHWRALVAHTDSHFGQEDRWMQDAGFSALNCHTRQHAMVLAVLHEGVRRGERGELDVIREMAAELAVWFPQHAQAMDAALAEQLAAVGFDPRTGTVRTPDAPHTPPGRAEPAGLETQRSAPF